MHRSMWRYIRDTFRAWVVFFSTDQSLRAFRVKKPIKFNWHKIFGSHTILKKKSNQKPNWDEQRLHHFRIKNSYNFWP